MSETESRITLVVDVKRGTEIDGWNHLKSEAEKISFLHPKLNCVVGADTYDGVVTKRLNEMPSWFDTEFCLISETDSVILNPFVWNDLFFEYDYIGAPWMAYGQLKYMTGRDGDRNLLVGNSGFSLWSRKLCELVATKYKDMHTLGENHDVFVCQKIRNLLIRDGIKFAPYWVAKRFSVEGQQYVGQFAAHGGFVFAGKTFNLKTMSAQEKESLIHVVC